MSSIIPEDQSKDKVIRLEQDFWELNKLFELSRRLGYAADIYSLAESFIEFVKSSMDIASVAFYILGEEKYYLVSSYNIESPSPMEFENHGSGIWQIIEEGKPFRVADDSGKTIYAQFFNLYNLDNLKACWWLPIIYENKTIAIISLGYKNSPKPYSEEEIDLINKISDHIAPALNRIQSREAKEKNIHYLQKSLHNISILYNIGQAINFIDDLKRLLKIILDKAIQTVSAEKGSLMLYDGSYDELVVKVVHGLPDKEVEDKINDGLIECTRIKVGEGIAGEVFQKKKPIITNLGSSDPKFKQSSNSRVSSILCVPLIIKGESIGVINITNKLGDGFFNHDDMEFMVALANHAAIAISNAQLYELATRDGLTKLFIYRHFQYLLDNEIKRAERYKHSVSLLMMDIDDFKIINDKHGHQIGDEILKEIAKIISTTCRKIDMPSRYGGEEFAVILPETGIENARKIAVRLRQRIENIKVLTQENVEIKPSISIGISAYPDLCNSQESLIGTADKALYYSKEHGKNCVTEYTATGCIIINRADGSTITKSDTPPGEK